MMSLKILHIYETCTGCGACVSACPRQALDLSYDKEGFYYPRLDADKCIQCKVCEKVCHVLNTDVPSVPSRNYIAYMLKAKDTDLVLKSSSGGAFSLLANDVLSDKGVVYGARYDYKNERLEHTSTEKCSMDELRKSKYIESYMGNTYAEIKDILLSGRKVLFCGTPCQVEGLHHFLSLKKVNMNKLLLVRFVCHGIPSNRYFTEYKHYEELKRNSKMVAFDFRPKNNGWRNQTFKMVFENGYKEIGPVGNYYYCRQFFISNVLRKSCYSCTRVFDEIADVTIADFWGIVKYNPKNTDQEGISLLLAHTENGRNAFDRIKNKCSFEVLPKSLLDYIYNEAVVKSKLLKDRNYTFEQVRKYGYIQSARKQLCLPIMRDKLIGKFYPLLKNVLKWKIKK